MNIFTKIISVSLSVTMAAMFVNLSGPSLSAQSDMQDSGLNYTESTDTDLSYPYCGCCSGEWINAGPGEMWSCDPHKFSLLLIDIGAYSSGVNTEKKDYDLDKSFFDSLENTLKNLRNNNTTAGIRLRYDSSGKNNPEPSDFQKVLDHISQLGSSGLLSKYEDVIAFVETGTVGTWGEQWGGKYVSVSEKARILDEYLSIVPDSISVLVRTPDTFREWLRVYCNITTDAHDMSYDITDPVLAVKASRVGLYDDGYMGSDSDLGTYSDRVSETKWLSGTNAFGGEFSGDDEYRLDFDTWLPQNALPEMYRTHLSRINSNIYKTRTVSQMYQTYEEASSKADKIQKLYKKAGLDISTAGTSVTQTDNGFEAKWNWPGYDSFIFDKKLDELLNVSCDNSAFYGKDLWQFIRAHIGCRYVLRSCSLTAEALPGDKLNINLDAENTGFSDSPKDLEAEILLSDDFVTYSYTADINPKNWHSGRLTSEKISIDLPKTLSGGSWNVYMRISAPDSSDKLNTSYCFRFANEGLTYRNDIGANYLGKIRIDGPSDNRKAPGHDFRAPGYYPEECTKKIDDSSVINLLDSSYQFTQNGRYGFTFLYKIEGIREPIQLGKWYLKFSDNSQNYSSAYTTYGVNTMNLSIADNGYYALHIPFFSAVFNFPGASSDSTVIEEFNFNDQRNYWDKNTCTKTGANNDAAITPLALTEGAPAGYNVTFHLPDNTISYTGSYGSEDKSSQTITNLKAVTALSLLKESYPEIIKDNNSHICRFTGFTTREGDRSSIISKDFIALGDIDLYALYVTDLTSTDFNAVKYDLVNGMDEQNIKYTLNGDLTAEVGDQSGWENNSAYCGGTQIIIPAFVAENGIQYTISKINAGAFSGDTQLNDIVIPGTVKEIGENSFSDECVIHTYKNSIADMLMSETKYITDNLEQNILFGDINEDSLVTCADAVTLIQWLTGSVSDINEKNADIDCDRRVTVADVIWLRNLIINHSL